MFDEFVPTRGSADALAAARGLVSESASALRLVLLFGPPGVGKSHLVRAVVDRFAQRRPGGSIVSTSARELLEEVTAALRAERLHDIHGRLGCAGLVAVDDLQVLRDVPRTQKEIGLLLKAAVRAGARVVAAAGCPLAHLTPVLDEVLPLRGAHAIEIGPPAEREMCRVLRKVATRRGLTVDAHTMAAVARRCGGDVGRGIGGLARVGFAQSLRRAG
jgi:chromosomal replication initiator protein